MSVWFINRNVRWLSYPACRCSFSTQPACCRMQGRKRTAGPRLHACHIGADASICVHLCPLLQVALCLTGEMLACSRLLRMHCRRSGLCLQLLLSRWQPYTYCNAIVPCTASMQRAVDTRRLRHCLCDVQPGLARQKLQQVGAAGMLLALVAAGFSLLHCCSMEPVLVHHRPGWCAAVARPPAQGPF